MREINILDDDILDNQERADFLPHAGKCLGLDIFAVFDDLFGALHGGNFFQSFLHTRRDQTIEGVARITLINLHDTRFWDAK